jgi:2-keto-4-pentenoate hydratase/2-oxohepta-3-ene-1,7-dioic acid hydratase in catechol pathway
VRIGAMRRDGIPVPVSVGTDGYVAMEEWSGRDVAGLLDVPAERLAAAATGAPSPGTPELDVPIRPGKIVAIGLNYLDHVRETGMAEPSAPLIFAKFPSSLTAHRTPIVVDPAMTERVDWEVELAVVIGRRAVKVAKEEALDHVFGYTVANDVSARDLQFADVQWIRGKSLDTFCPLGPWVVTADEIADPQDLRLRTWVNGELVQDSSTAEMIFGVDELIAYCSRHFALEPGDVILTGTPWGCGEFMDPPRHLRPGDEVVVEVEGVGRLENPVVAAGEGAA